MAAYRLVLLGLPNSSNKPIPWARLIGAYTQKLSVVRLSIGIWWCLKAHCRNHTAKTKHTFQRYAATNSAAYFRSTGKMRCASFYFERGCPEHSAPRLHSTSRLMRVALTSVHPGCGLHPVHPGCTSGYGDWWAGMLAGACSGLYAYFSAPPAPQNARRWPKPPPGASSSAGILQIVELSSTQSMREIRFGPDNGAARVSLRFR
jgi:hypothetical protein